MDERVQRRIQRYGWDEAASVYDDAWADNLRPAHDALLEMADLFPGLHVVEAAAGDGLVTFRVAAAVSEKGKVVATDISGEMAAKGATEAKARGLAQVKFERMEAEALTLADNTFDRAICALGLMYVPRPEKALSEMARILRPGGRGTVLVWGERRNCGWAELFPITDAEVKSEVCPLFFSLGVPGVLSGALTQSKFHQVEERRITGLMHFADRESLLRAVIDGGAVALAAKRYTPETRARVDDAFTASVEAFRVDSGYEIPGEFVVATGVM